MKLIGHICYLLLFLLFVSQSGTAQGQQNILKEKTICLDPGHGGTADTDQYRVGPTGEREEWINLRVGKVLKKLLEDRGAKVVMTREEDVRVPLSKRAQIAVENEADVFVSIHHNATADSTVNFPIIYYHGNASENQAGVMLGQLLVEKLSSKLYKDQNPASLVSDRVIFPGGGTAVLRGTYGIPAVLAEASFFTNPAEEQRLKDSEYNLEEAKAYLEALQSFFSNKQKPIYDLESRVKVTPFRVLQEEERMKPIARKWKSDFREGYELYCKGDSTPLQKALEYFTRSARSFPDSWLSRRSHYYRAKIFGKIGKPQKQNMAKTRAEEYYVPLNRNEEYLQKLISE